jgi:polyhydroxybutyrate depolymerase
MRSILATLAFLSVGAAGCGTSSGLVDAGGDDASDAASAPDLAPQGPTCAAGSKTGVDGDSVTTAAGTSVLVRTPAGYDPKVGSPLIVVYAACCVAGPVMEQFTGLTPGATARHYLIAYVDHITPTSLAAYMDGADVPGTIAAQFCVDPAHVFLTGHSDGGSLSEAVVVEGLFTPAAIAPSASGVRPTSLNASMCPMQPLPVFEMHSSGDQLFPISQGFGPPMAMWWAQCDGCGAEQPMRGDGCIPYASCMGGAQVLYCQGSAAHGVWPMRDAAMLDFFDQYRGK